MTQPSTSEANGVIRILHKHEDTEKFFRCELCNIRQHWTPQKFEEHMNSFEHRNMKLLHDYGMWPGQSEYAHEDEMRAAGISYQLIKLLDKCRKDEALKQKTPVEIQKNCNALKKKVDKITEELKYKTIVEKTKNALAPFPFKFAGLNDGRVYCISCSQLFEDATKLLIHQMTSEHNERRRLLGISDIYKTLYYCEHCNAFIGHSHIPFESHLITNLHRENVTSQERLKKCLSTRFPSSYRIPPTNSPLKAVANQSQSSVSNVTVDGGGSSTAFLADSIRESPEVVILGRASGAQAIETTQPNVVDSSANLAKKPMRSLKKLGAKKNRAVSAILANNKLQSNLINVTDGTAGSSSSSDATVQSTTKRMPPVSFCANVTDRKRLRQAKNSAEGSQKSTTGFLSMSSSLPTTRPGRTQEQFQYHLLPPALSVAGIKHFPPSVVYNPPPPPALSVNQQYPTSFTYEIAPPSALTIERYSTSSATESICDAVSSSLSAPSASSATLPAAFNQPGLKDLLSKLVNTSTVSLQATLLSQLLEEKLRGAEKQREFEAKMKQLMQLYADEKAAWVWEGIDPNLKPEGSILLDLNQYYLQLEYQENRHLPSKSRVSDTAITKYKGNLATVAQMVGASVLLVEALPMATDTELKQLVDELCPAVVAVAVSPEGSQLLCELLTHYALSRDDRYRLVRTLAESLTPDAVAVLLSQADKVRILDSAFRVGVENRYRLARLVIPMLIKVDDKLDETTDAAVKTMNALRRSAAFVRHMLQVVGVVDLKSLIAPLFNTADAVHELCDRVLGRVLIDAVLESDDQELRAMVFQRVLTPLDGDKFLQFATKNRNIGQFVETCVRRCGVEAVSAFGEYTMADNCRLLTALLCHSSGNYIVRALWFAADQQLKQTIAIRLRPLMSQLLIGKYSRHMASVISQFDASVNLSYAL